MVSFDLVLFVGDASSPHGSNCVQFSGTPIGGEGSTSSSSSPSPSTVNEGLTRQQLDLISQIMQQTKVNTGFTSNNPRQVQRPRTWNMQVNLRT